MLAYSTRYVDSCIGPDNHLGKTRHGGESVLSLIRENLRTLSTALHGQPLPGGVIICTTGKRLMYASVSVNTCTGLCWT